MAWNARVTAKNPDYDAGKVTVNVEYFDDAAPTTVLHTEQFNFDAWLSSSEMVTDVKKVGSTERRKRLQVDTLAGQIAVGTVIVV